MPLIKVERRASKQLDSEAIAKANKIQTVAAAVKGGTNLYSRIQQIVAAVNTKLGKYKDKYVIIRTQEELDEYFTAIIRNGDGAIDTETTGLDPILCTLAGVCLYTPGRRPAYLPVNHISSITNEKVSNQLEPEQLKEWFKKCNEANVKWIMHNGKYDIRVIKHQVGVKIGCYWDTMLAAKCLNENEPAGLKPLHLKYCNSEDAEAFTFDKLFDGIPFTLIPISTGYLYAAGDAIKTYELFEFQKKHLNRAKLPGPYNVFRNIEMPLLDVIVQMEDNGITLDMEFAQQLSVKYNEQLKEREDKFYTVLSEYSDKIDEYKKTHPNHKLSDPVSIGSSTQIATILYDILHLQSPDPDKPRGTGEEILLQLDCPLSKVILDYRETQKLLSTYIDKLPQVVNPKDGKIHCSFNQYGAATGRLSSSEPNLQNIPSHNKEIRQMFVASPGHILISSDFSQQEPRTLAHMSGDKGLIQSYLDGKDIYAWIASEIYKVPYDDCKEFYPDGSKNPKGKERRSSVKSIILGIMYSRGAKAIGEQLGVSTKEAQGIVDTFFKSFPKVKQFIENTENHAIEYGYVETAWGRKRRLPDIQLPEFEFEPIGLQATTFDPLDFDNSTDSFNVDPKLVEHYTKKLKQAWSFQAKRDIKEEARTKGIKIIDNGGKINDAKRQCVNSVIQGTAADMSKKAMIAIHNDPELQRMECKLLIPVHDEVIVECPDRYGKQVAARVTQLMIDAAKEKISVPMKCDAEATRAWYGEEVDLDSLDA